MATHTTVSGNTNTGDLAEKHSSSAGRQRHHAIARVASAHGPRDSILSFQHHQHQQIQQQPSTPQQQQHFGRHHSPSPFVVPSSGPPRMVGGSAPPALNACAIGQPGGNIAIPPPPQYEQAVASVANNLGVDQATGNCGNAKFSTRKSPESRAPVQAVLPMQPSLMREVIPSPTSIPDECQVVKQLVREMASGQLSMHGNTITTASSGADAGVIPVTPPPAYNHHQQQSQIRQHQPPAASNVSSTSSKPSNTHCFTSSSTAHPLLEGGLGPASSNGHRGHSQAPKETNASSSQRMSLSHPDLSRLQNLQLSTWQSPSHAMHIDESMTEMASAQDSGLVLHSAAALSAMAASLTSSIGSSQGSAGKGTQKTQQVHQQQQVNTNVTAGGQQSLFNKLLEHGITFTPGQGIVGSTFGSRPASAQSQPTFSEAMPAFYYAHNRPPEFAQFPNADVQHHMPTSAHPQAIPNANMASHSVLSTPNASAARRSSMETHETDLEANAFTRMINLLKEENRNLRSELDIYMKKSFKLQHLELQYQKLCREYEDLVRRQEKREELEEQMRNKMRQDNARLRDVNVHLRDQLENTLAQMAHLQTDDAEDADLRHELIRREMMMAQLITQNKELLACKERQEIELEAQRQTLDDQRSHITILDNALTNAQERNLRLDDECKKKSMYVQRAEQLQRTVQQLQEAMQKNEENHKRVRAELEKELAKEQLQKKDTQLTKQSSSSRCLQDFNDTLAKLKRDLRDRDDQISALQQDVVRWQNMYYEESKKRQTDLDEAADNKDARIRILEETSDKAEKMVESARVESKRYLDDLRISKTKISELETKIQGLEARIAEKDAMINVLRRRQNVPFGDASINARSAEATLSEPYNPHETKQRLEAVRRRLLQSPSPSRYTPRLYQRHGHKFTSIDASFSLDSDDYASLSRPPRKNKVTVNIGKGGNTASCVTSSNDNNANSTRTQHNRTQSSCDSYLSPSASGLIEKSNTNSLAAFKKREIFTLPTRRSRTKLLPTEQAKFSRTRSADDHLLNKTESMEEADANTPDSRIEAAGTLFDSNTNKIESDKEENEELWNV